MKVLGVNFFLKHSVYTAVGYTIYMAAMRDSARLTLPLRKAIMYHCTDHFTFRISLAETKD